MRMRASVGATEERHQSADSAETRGCSYRVLAVARECRCSGTLDALSSLSSGLPPLSAPGKWASAWFRHWGRLNDTGGFNGSPQRGTGVIFTSETATVALGYNILLLVTISYVNHLQHSLL